MRYMVRVSEVRIVGAIWQPGVTAAQTLTLSESDVDNARSDSGEITRESLGDWLNTHAGDFSDIIDFRASIEDGERTVEIDWRDEESELLFNDCTYPDED